MEKLIITVATTGSGTPLSKCPNLAITPEQIAPKKTNITTLVAATPVVDPISAKLELNR